MKRSAVRGLVGLFAMLVTTSARADGDYYQALAEAERAAAEGNYPAGLRVVNKALQSYPGDYTFTLTRARMQMRLKRYTDAENSYRAAIRISDGALDARLGLGWALQLQGDCPAATREFARVLRAQPANPAAQRGIEACQAGTGLHGSFWLTLGGAVFQDHPWKQRFADVSAGFTLAPTGAFMLGLAYHQLRLDATDRRVAAVNQHELYVQSGFRSGKFQLLGHGALVWSLDPRSDGSTHGGVSGRYQAFDQVLQEVTGEVMISRYPDLWVGRVATAWRFAVDAWNITPGLGVIKVRNEALAAVSMSLGRSFGALSVWVGGKYGPEYRAAYLPQFSLLNSEDRSVWSATTGMRATLNEHWLLLAAYIYLRMRTQDGLYAGMHLINLGAVYVF